MIRVRNTFASCMASQKASSGSSVVITADVDENGFRYLQMQIDDYNTNHFVVESDLGYYGDIYQTQYGWNNNGANDGTIDVEYIYARKGTLDAMWTDEKEICNVRFVDEQQELRSYAYPQLRVLLFHN